ncbi:toll-like receptor 8 isoform X2 [Alosa sapidissima]|uniref:toll-like receptor 8 isoform X2 n=1 Tax=Alosa sapidissima TaxID=34773 RepID=UPI001C09FF1E|nr:toll-like receptor 8 isoform X2 [Alosa sapidissima]
MAAHTFLIIEKWLIFSLIISSTLGVFVTKDLRKVPCDVDVNATATVFNCMRRGLRKIPDGIYRNVTSLSLAGNSIRNVSVDSFRDFLNLTHLDLNWINKNNHVNLTDSVFKNLTSLKQLWLSGVGLHNVPKQLPSGLKHIVLDENKIISLNDSSFSDIKNVTEISLSKNCYSGNECKKTFNVTEKSFSNLSRLENLILSFNNITKVPQGLPGSLKELDLAENRIESIFKDDFSNLVNLQFLRIQGNCPRCKNAPYPCVPCKNGSIEIHPQAFDSLSKLQVLQLAGNSLQTMNSSWFKNLSNLTDLFLSFNFLTSAIADGTFLMNLPRLEKLDLSYNFDLLAYPKTLNLSMHFSRLVSLRTLHMEGYVFQEIMEDTFKPLQNLSNLYVLNLGVNFIVHSNSNAFKHLPKLALLYLSENRLYPVTVNKNSASNEAESSNGLVTGNYITLQDKGFVYELSRHLIKPECFNTGRVLDLSRNNLFFISQKEFEGYDGDILCLNLSRNGFSAAPNGTEFTPLPNLTYLDLSYNKVDLAYDFAFSELKHLEVLDLSYNNHYFTVAGVTHNLNFLENLHALRILNLSSNSIFTLTTKYMNSTSLNELQFQHNQLSHMWKKDDDSYHNLFTNLVNLTYLDISYNDIRKIPSKVFTSLPHYIRKLRISHNSLTDFQWSNLSNLQYLEELDMSYNELSTVSSNLSANTKSLSVLDLSFNRISKLSDGFINGAKSLRLLNLSKNKLSIISEGTFPPGSDAYLKTLLLQGNPFHCTCDLLEFILWIEKSDINIPRLATSVACAMPEERRGHPVILFDINECVNDSMASLFYSLSTLLILLTLFIATTMHLFYWDASYVLFYIKAKLKGYHSLESSDSIYDAFVSYDTSDPLVSEWVLNHLSVQLEETGDKLSPICLEERDWTPGVPILDNLTQSIYQSRKTVFVLTESYVKSGNFRMAVYLAHQRLLDDNVDVIVLLLLEPVLQHSHFLRLRRRLCQRSVLEWPKTPSAEPWFWQCLRNAIHVDNQVMYNKVYARYFCDKDKRRKH